MLFNLRWFNLLKDNSIQLQSVLFMDEEQNEKNSRLIFYDFWRWNIFGKSNKQIIGRKEKSN